MDPLLILFLLAVPVAFVGGVLVHKYVVSEAQSIKEHVTAEVEQLSADIAVTLNKYVGKV